MDKIAKDDTPRHAIKRNLKDVLHARNVTTEIERQLKENRRLQAEKARQLQMEKDMKEKEAKRRTLEKAKIAALIDKHRSRTPNTPDEVNKLGTGNNVDANEKQRPEKVQPQYNVIWIINSFFKRFIILHTFINDGGKTYTMAYTNYIVKCISRNVYKGRNADSSFRG